MSDESKSKHKTSFTATLLFALWIIGIGPCYLANREIGWSMTKAYLSAAGWPAMVPFVVADWIRHNLKK